MDIRDTATLRAGRLAVNFERRGDRIAHRIFLVEGTGEQLLLESIEGTPDEPWPPSPALQEGRIESAGGREAAMLVGMAGKSHWSVSIEADAQRESLTFDVACRVKEPAGRLVSEYSSTGQLAAVAQICCEENCRLSREANRLLFAPLIEQAGLPTTIRWRYQISTNGKTVV